MAASYEHHQLPYWSYSPYPYNNSYETSPTNSSYFESPLSSSHIPVFPAYDQQQSCYYYPDQSFSYHEYGPPSPPFATVPQLPQVPSISPPLPPSSTHQPNRLQYTNRQRWLLNEIFEQVPYPNSVQKNVIADRIGATREQIRIWFQNRRRIAVQNNHSTSRRNNPVPIDYRHTIQLELDSILVDLVQHKNAPQRMPIGQGTSSRRVRQVKKID